MERNEFILGKSLFTLCFEWNFFNLNDFDLLYFLLFNIGSIAMGTNANRTAATPMYGRFQLDQNFLFGRNIIVVTSESELDLAPNEEPFNSSNTLYNFRYCLLDAATILSVPLQYSLFTKCCDTNINRSRCVITLKKVQRDVVACLLN